MGFFDKIKDLGSRIIKPVIKPYHPSKLPVLRKLPEIAFKPTIKPVITGTPPISFNKPPKNILLSNGMALK